MEGVLYSICSVVNALKQSLGTIDRVQASGGFARSPEWVQMLADIIGQDVSLPPSHHASALGAVLLAKHAIGELDMFAAAKTEKKSRDSFLSLTFSIQKYTKSCLLCMNACTKN